MICMYYNMIRFSLFLIEFRFIIIFFFAFRRGGARPQHCHEGFTATLQAYLRAKIPAPGCASMLPETHDPTLTD